MIRAITAPVFPVTDPPRVPGWAVPRRLVTSDVEAASSGTPAPFAAAAIAAEVHALRPDAELLAWWLADLVLAQRLRWPFPVPLLIGQAHGSAFRSAGGRSRIRPGGEGFERAVCL